ALFAGELSLLTDEVEMQLVNERKAVIRRELVVPEVAFEAFATMMLKADGALTSTSGSKDNNLIGTYRVPVALDVAALKNAETFMQEMRALVDALYGEGIETLDKIS
ncbi:hypothetical protein KF707_20605, partial [Candidatus Obscuribacterales bacterium]|nr:hypothetical protein [Candidatus Obscuribacterales bacterium]